MGLLDELTRDRRRLLAAVLLLLLLAAAVRLYHIQWSFSNNGIDEGVMIERSLMVSHGYKLYAELPCDQAPLAFYIGSLFGGDVVSLRVLVAALSLLAIGASMFVSMRIKDSKAMLLTGLLLSLDFVFLRESRLFSLDAVSSCFIAFSIPAFLSYVRKGDRSMLALAGLFAGLSTASKLFGALALIGMLLFMVLESRREKKGFAKAAIDMLLVTVVAALPLVAFMAYLGPGDMIQGMVFDQGQRGFDPFLKLSIVAFLGLNIAYVLPLVYARSLWRRSKETRYVLCLSLVILAFMVVQPLVFLHHMTLLSPPLAILAGVFISDALKTDKSVSENSNNGRLVNKRTISRNAAIAVFAVGIIISASIGTYGLALQKKPAQAAYADWLRTATAPGDFVVSGDPIICAYADRMMPPEVVNVAFRQHTDLTLDTIIQAIHDYNVSVVIVGYRLNSLEGLTSYLNTSGFVKVVIPIATSTAAALDLFQEEVGPITVYARGT